MKPVLYIVIPCYNEEKVLPITSGMFLEKLKSLISEAVISDDSRIMFVNDGSRDSTWDIITGLSEEEKYFTGISLSRNRGHQNALLAGLTEAGKLCDITISIDCDGQDDINAMDSMVREYLDGAEIVYGVRSSRETDTFFKRTTAQGFYKLMNRMGANVVYNHADYRLLSAKVIKELANFKEVNIFLRGMIPLVGFKSTCVYYENYNHLRVCYCNFKSYRHNMVGNSLCARQNRGGLGFACNHYFLFQRNTAFKPRRNRRIYR